MGSVVKYRDVPGGPTDVEMGEEISRHCLCTQCGMLSMAILQDHQEHVFCMACVEERSCKMEEHIFCKYEQNNVSLDEMFQAKDVLTVIRDQIAVCPNKLCSKSVRLEELHDHYSQCTPRVQCPVCRQPVQSAEWKTHWKIHSLGGSQEHFAIRSNQSEPFGDHSSKNTAHQHKQLLNPTLPSTEHPAPNPEYYAQSESRSRKVSARFSPGPRSQLSSSSSFFQEPEPIPNVDRLDRNYSNLLTEASALPKRSLEADNRRGEGKSASNCVTCQYCKRPVKDTNLISHWKTCFRAPKACVYCEKNIPLQEMAAHIKYCECNPDKATKTTGAPADDSTDAGQVKPVNKPHETPGVKFEAHGTVCLGPTFPELPTLALSYEQMEIWRDALEQHLSMLRITDNRARYEILVSTLLPEIVSQVKETPVPILPGCEYECLLKALFMLRESTMKRGSNRQTDEGSDNILGKLTEKAHQGMEVLCDRIYNVRDGIPEAQELYEFYVQDFDCVLIDRKYVNS